jgi:hypothetical protein
MASIINATTSTGLVSSADNSGSLQLATNNGTTAVTIDTSQRVGIGTTTPDSSTKLEVSGGQFRLTASSASSMFLVNPSTTYADGVDIQATYNGAGSFGPLKFTTSSTERMRIASDGAVLINRTSPANSERLGVTGNVGSQCMSMTSPITGAYDMCNIINGNGQVGVIQTNGTSTSYVTSSDYRLKENVAPMTGALATVALLKPCTYTWKVDGSAGQGFIAHELQAVVPDAVVGEKDAVNEDGSIKPQGVDTSFLVATLTAAIQELNAKVEAQAVRIAELEGAK